MLHELGAVPVVADALDPDQVAEAVGAREAGGDRPPADRDCREWTCATSIAISRPPTGCGPRGPTTCSRPDRRWACGGSSRRAMQLWRVCADRAAVKTEEDPLDPKPAREMREIVAAIRHLEQAVLGAAWTEGIVLRYGAFYGPGTSLAPGARAVRADPQAQVPDRRRRWRGVVVHARRRRGRGDASRLSSTVPRRLQRRRRRPSTGRRVAAGAGARRSGAEQPMRVPRFDRARLFAGEVGVVMMTEMRGASNAKAKRELAWQPGAPELAAGVRGGMTDREHCLSSCGRCAFAIAYRMLGSVVRGRGRGAGGAAAGAPGARRRRADRVAAGVRRHRDHPAGDQRAALRARPARALRRRVAARADHHRQPTTIRPAMRRWPTRCRWRCWCCWRASRRSSGPCCCCTTCSTTGTRRSRRSSARARTTCASSPPARRRHVEQRRPRFQTTREQRDELARRFFAAAEQGDLAGLEALLAARRGADRRRRRQGTGARAIAARAQPCRAHPAQLAPPRRPPPGRVVAPRRGQRRPGSAAISTRQQRLIAVLALDIGGGQIKASARSSTPTSSRTSGQSATSHP